MARLEFVTDKRLSAIAESHIRKCIRFGVLDAGLSGSLLSLLASRDSIQIATISENPSEDLVRGTNFEAIRCPRETDFGSPISMASVLLTLAIHSVSNGAFVVSDVIISEGDLGGVTLPRLIGFNGHVYHVVDASPDCIDGVEQAIRQGFRIKYSLGWVTPAGTHADVRSDYRESGWRSGDPFLFIAGAFDSSGFVIARL